MRINGRFNGGITINARFNRGIQGIASSLGSERFRGVEENFRWIESITLSRLKHLFASIVADVRARELATLRRALYDAFAPYIPSSYHICVYTG